MNSMLTNQQSIFNKVFLNRIADKTRLCIDQLNVVSRGSKEPSPAFPLGAMISAFANSVFVVTLKNMVTVNYENWLYLCICA